MPARAVVIKLLILIPLVLLAPAQTVSSPKAAAAGTEVRFDHVELVSGYILLHIYTQRGRSYTIQTATNFPATNWVNFRFVPPNFQDSHAILNDPITNQRRFYRMFASP